MRLGLRWHYPISFFHISVPARLWAAGWIGRVGRLPSSSVCTSTSRAGMHTCREARWVTSCVRVCVCVQYELLFLLMDLHRGVWVTPWPLEMSRWDVQMSVWPGGILVCVWCRRRVCARRRSKCSTGTGRADALAKWGRSGPFGIRFEDVVLPDWEPWRRGCI